MAKLAKVMRFQIVKPMNEKWEELGPILRDLQRDTQKVMNKTITMCWEYQSFSHAFKEKNGVYPNTQEVLKYKTIEGFCCNELKHEFYKMPSNIRDTTIRNAAKKWRNDLKEVLAGERSIASFKKDVPIDLHDRSIEVMKHDHEYVIKLGLLSDKYKKELDKKIGKYDVKIAAKDKSQKVILDRILDGSYKIGASKLIYDKNKWFINLVYKFEQFESVLDKDNIMGIDLGIVNPIYMAFNNSLHRYKVTGGEIDKMRRTVEKEKKTCHSRRHIAERVDEDMGSKRESRRSIKSDIRSKILQIHLIINIRNMLST